jgi:AGZA family xanthine/uracil permease-like MFS transporter
MTQSETAQTARWWTLTRGDIDATVAQVGFNVAQMIIPAFLLAPVGIAMGFSLSHLLPGYALGFFAASMGFTALGAQLAKREGRSDVTAHVYINNVPGIIAYTLSIMLPVYLQTRDAELAWRIGAAAVVWTGVIKLAAAPLAGAIRSFIPKPATMTVFGAAMYTYLAMVLLQRIFDQPLVGILALTIVAAAGLAEIPITRWRIPMFLVAWLVPLAAGLAVHYVHPAWTGFSPQLPYVHTPGLLQAMRLAIPYLSVIAPMSIYQVLQDIASVEGGAAAGDNYDARLIVACDGIGTLLCGVGGSNITPVVAALHPPYKRMGARIGFCFWTGILFLAVVMGGISVFMAQLFPWAILAAMIAYVAIGVGRATLHRVDHKYITAVLLGLVLPTGAVVGSAVSAALPALKLSAQNPEVQAALNRSIYWSSLQGLGNGFLFLVLVISAMITELIDRKFGRAAFWCLLASVFSWLGLMHSATLNWGAQPMYAVGWLAAAAIVYSARWWRGDVTPAK